jgi:Ca2+:H+ antiporter
MSALLTLAASALVIPTILFSSLLEAKDGKPSDIMSVSRGTAIVLILIYIVYLVFQLKTHSELFKNESEGAEVEEESDDEEEAQSKSDENEDRILSTTGSIICLIMSTVCVGFCVEFLVDTVNDIVDETGMTKTFIGIILLPIISNAAEHVTAVVVSWKGKMNLALLVDLGSGLQITIFVTPLLIILAWIMDKELTLQFQAFETIVFLLSVLVVNFLMNGGSANYMEGCMCVGWYVIIAIAFFYYPDGEDHV